MDTTGKNIIRNFNFFDEDKKWKSLHGVIEEEHTQRLIARHINATPLAIYNIGGEAGHIALWLAALGHQIYVSDIVPKHTEIVRDKFGDHENIAFIDIKDPRNLSYKNEVADLIILNGPLYHLTKKENRLKVLIETKRILKKGGRLLGFTISRLASLSCAISSGNVFEDDYFNVVKEEISSGVRNNLLLTNDTFMPTYSHFQKDIEAEFRASGLAVESTYGVGLSWQAPDQERLVKDEEKKVRLLQAAEACEAFPMLSPKMMTVGIKY